MLYARENRQYESVYFKELHKDQGYNWPTTYRAGAAVVSTINYYAVIEHVAKKCYWRILKMPLHLPSTVAFTQKSTFDWVNVGIVTQQKHPIFRRSKKTKTMLMITEIACRCDMHI